jgi:magnesium transporter
MKIPNPKRHQVRPLHLPRLRFRKPGSPPGSLIPAPSDAGAPSAPARVQLIRYDRAGVEEDEIAHLEEFDTPAEEDKITWLYLKGRPTSEQLKRLRDLYELHPLALEDVLSGQSRAKYESYDAQYFVIMSHMNRRDGALCTDQVSFFLGQNYVISIDEGPNDIFEPVRQRLRKKRIVLSRGADFLLYALMDVIIDTGFPVLDQLGERLEDLEDEILDNPTREARNQIHLVKRELVMMRRAWWPQREVVSSLIRDGEHFLGENTRVYMRDCYDHCVILIDFVETYRDIASNLLDTYLSAVSQRMNDIMKALTIIATIFLPLSFIAGLYGMNFDTKSRWNMPELAWHFGYFYALGVMLAIVITMLAWFKRKGWL